MNPIRPLAYLLILGQPPSLSEALECPPGTEFRVEPTHRQDLAAPSSDTEEFCIRTQGPAIGLRHGPYVLWGPNNQKKIEGQYRDGAKDGVWSYRTPIQTTERVWDQGRKVGARALSTVSSTLSIDFRGCSPQAYRIPAAFGSTTYAVEGKDGADCLFGYSVEIELGAGPRFLCRVPRTLGVQTFVNTDLGVDFAALNEFCRAEAR